MSLTKTADASAVSPVVSRGSASAALGAEPPRGANTATTAAPSATRSSPLALRLTVWYSICFLLVLLAAVAVLYLSLAESLRRDHDQFLSDKVRVIRQLLHDRPADRLALQEEVEENWAPHQYVQVEARVSTQAGTLICESPGMGQRLPANMFPAPAGVDQLPAEGQSVHGNAGGPFRIMAARAVLGSVAPNVPPMDVLIQVALDTQTEQRLLADYRRQLLIVSGLATVLSVVVGYQVARRGLRPVYEIARTAQQVGPSRLDARIRVAGLPAELSALAETLNGMLERLDDAFGRLSRFSADIAHELRTPVNNLRMAIEVTLGKTRTPDDYRDTLGSALEECARLGRIIDSLLFIARAEDPRTQVSRESMDVMDELERVCEFFEAPASEAGIVLELRGVRPLRASFDRTLLHRAVANLISNALDHTPRGGHVTVSALASNGQIEVGVADTGRGIRSEDLPHVFDRFYRADTSRSVPAGHSGLGLAIVKTIVALHGGTVNIRSVAGSGTEVSLRFPQTVAPTPALG